MSRSSTKFEACLSYPEIGFITQVVGDFMTVWSRVLPQCATMAYMAEHGWELHVQPMPQHKPHPDGDFAYLTTYRKIK